MQLEAIERRTTVDLVVDRSAARGSKIRSWPPVRGFPASLNWWNSCRLVVPCFGKRCATEAEVAGATDGSFLLSKSWSVIQFLNHFPLSLIEDPQPVNMSYKLT